MSVDRYIDMKLLRAPAFYSLAAAACLTSIASGQETAWGTTTDGEVKKDKPSSTQKIMSVGMKNPRPACDAAGQESGCSVGLDLMTALEKDERLTG